MGQSFCTANCGEFEKRQINSDKKSSLAGGGFFVWGFG
jgi:hypothetical protein